MFFCWVHRNEDLITVIPTYNAYSNALIGWSARKFCTSSHVLGQTRRLTPKDKNDQKPKCFHL